MNFKKSTENLYSICSWLVSIHVLVGPQRCSISFDVWAPLLTNNLSLCNKSMRARNKIARIEILRGHNILWHVGTDNAGHKRILSSEKKEQSSKQKKYSTTTFGKSSFLTQYRMRYAIYIPSNTKDFAINLTMVAYGNRQNAITSKQLRFFASTETINGNQASGILEL